MSPQFVSKGGTWVPVPVEQPKAPDVTVPEAPKEKVKEVKEPDTKPKPKKRGRPKKGR